MSLYAELYIQKDGTYTGAVGASIPGLIKEAIEHAKQRGPINLSVNQVFIRIQGDSDPVLTHCAYQDAGPYDWVGPCVLEMNDFADPFAEFQEAL